MGGFYTSSELLVEVQRLVDAYPEWVRPVTGLGSSLEGRALSALCVTAELEGCDGYSEERPAVLYTSLVHAREPATATCLVGFLRRLLEEARSGVNGTTMLLATRKLIFVPNANPDGYAWNEKYHPRGGGMKRKNGHRTCGAAEQSGVDINRNFGRFWNYDEVGSSSHGCSQQYRGSAPFSEPETRAIRQLVRLHRPTAVLHWHGWGNDLAYPFSYDWRAPMAIDELQLFQELSGEMTARNGYAAGRGFETVGYSTNGDSDDWGWGEAGAVSMTIEVGSSDDSFWPPPVRIAPLIEESIYPARYLAWAAGAMLQIDAVQLSGTTGTAAAGTVDVTVTLQNNGLRPFAATHRACAPVRAGATALVASDGWEVADGSACATLPALGARASAVLPLLRLAWPSPSPSPSSSSSSSEDEDEGEGEGEGGAEVEGDEAEGGDAGERWLQLPLRVSIDDVGGVTGAAAAQLRLRLLASTATLTGCDGDCLCRASAAVDDDEDASGPGSSFDYSHRCRDALPAGSHCRLAKAALPEQQPRDGFVADGTIDEWFVYRPAHRYAIGGTCTVHTTNRDAILTVYRRCSRWGAQEAIAFSNGDGLRPVSASFACAAEPLFLFWNAEFIPGRFSFEVSEGCADSSSCVLIGPPEAPAPPTPPAPPSTPSPLMPPRSSPAAPGGIVAGGIVLLVACLLAAVSCRRWHVRRRAAGQHARLTGQASAGKSDAVQLTSTADAIEIVEVVSAAP